MRVGLNLLYLVPEEVGGSEIYARELIAALAAEEPDWEFVVFCGREASAVLPDDSWPSNVRVRELGFNARNKPARLAWELLALPRAAKREKIELMHSLGQTTPWWGCGTRVVTILDLIYHHYPATFPRAAQRGLEFVIPRGARRADRIVAISAATADDLAASYGIDRAKIDVTLLGAGFAEAPRISSRAEIAETIGLPAGEFALSVASGHEHKNIPRLLKAFASLGAGRRLVVVGRSGLEDEQLAATATELGIADRVIFTGWVDEATLEGLYREAELFVYPTLMEGFGLPVLEAMHRGLPVACSNVSSLPEVAGDAALTFNPLDESAIAEALERLFTDADLRAELTVLGRAQAARFTWQRCAEDTLSSYRIALAQ
ncbi:MAG: glycosyltransferase family 4 protein [Thermoleophilaceae bacterium]|nr:glycosyltransferase family 4 protein [Thermoleophilaceae bacterium]